MLLLLKTVSHTRHCFLAGHCIHLLSIHLNNTNYTYYFFTLPIHWLSSDAGDQTPSGRHCLLYGPSRMYPVWHVTVHVVPNGTSPAVHAAGYVKPSRTTGSGRHVISGKNKAFWFIQIVFTCVLYNKLCYMFWVMQFEGKTYVTFLYAYIKCERVNVNNITN